MCGIVGVASVSSTQDLDLVRRQCASLHHRGPDSGGIFVSREGNLAFAHRRLAVLDLSEAGHQPMMAASGRHWIVYNGEIYNHEALRKELRGIGLIPRSATDTELLVEAYAKWDLAFLDRVHGMFALAIFDEANERLVLARDRVGEKPLYYCMAGGTLRFASELKALLLAPDVPKTLNEVALQEYLAYGYVSAPNTLLSGVRKLQPGCALTMCLRTGDVVVKQWWNLPNSPSMITSTSGPELVLHLEQVLGESVRDQLVADVPVGVLLSGGLDSSLISSLAARVATGSINTFTVSLRGAGSFDETRFARRVAEHIGSIHHEVPGNDLAPSDMHRLARQFDEPLADSSLLPTALVSSLIRRSATVALGGDGGDELFGGYPFYSRILRLQRILRHVPKFVTAGIASAAMRIPLGMRGRNDLLGVHGGVGGSMAHVRLFFDAKWRTRLLRQSPRHSDTATPERIRSELRGDASSATRQMLECDALSYLPDDLLTKVDRASMMYSLEVRAPFLHPRVIDFAFSNVPDHLRVTETGRKILLRQLAARLLPPDFDLVRKQGFSIPISEWFRGSWRGEIQDVLLDDGCLFARSAVERIVSRLDSGADVGRHLFCLIMFELWRREYGSGLS